MFDPHIRIKGKKTLIRPFVEGDISNRYLSWLNDKDLMGFSNQRFFKHDRSTSLSYLRSFSGTSNGFFAIENSSGRNLIGTMTVYFDDRLRVADVGILIGDKSVAGQGYGTDCWCAMITWLRGRSEVRKVTAGTLSINKPMLSLMRAANMIEDGCRKQQEIVDGEPTDILYFALFP